MSEHKVTRDFSAEARDQRIKQLGPRFADGCLSSLHGRAEIQNKIMSFVKKKKNFLVYVGNPGLGKTHLCGALFEWAIMNFPSFRYFTEKELQEKIRKITIENGWDAHRELLRLFDSDVIFLDDVGKSKYSDYKEDILFDAVDIRYNSLKPTVITSNLSKKEFYEIYEPRLCSRIFDKDNIIIEEMNGIDHRVDLDKND